MRTAPPGCRLVTSFLPLFNAPFTPLQFDEVRTLSQDLCRWLENVARGAGAEFRWSASPDEVRLMSLLCRAGRAASSIVAKLSLEDGVRYYDGLPSSALREAERVLNPNLAKARRESDVLPWDDLEAGASRSALWTAFRKSKSDVGLPALHGGETTTRLKSPGHSPASQTVSQSFWVEIPDSSSHHPSATLARGILRGLLAADPAAAIAYSGTPQLHHPPGASGLALLTAFFRGAEDLPTALQDPPAVDELVFLAECDTPGVRKILDELRSGRIPFQTERHENDRWSVIKKGYRNKCGLWALCERDSAPGLVLCSSQAKQLAGFAARVISVFERSGSLLKLLKSTSAIQIPEAVVQKG